MPEIPQFSSWPSAFGYYPSGSKEEIVLRTSILVLILAASFACAQSRRSEQRFRAQVPRMWDDAAMADLELPLPRARYSLRQVKAEYYYRIPIRPVYKTYPVYPIQNEPAGYIDRLQHEDPAVVFDSGKLKSRQDWIRAGELVFDAPIALFGMDAVRDPGFVARTGVPLASDGSIPTLRYVIRKKGTVQLGSFSCGMCHTRVQPDGSLIKGAQGNFPGDRVVAFSVRRLAAADMEQALKEAQYNARSTFQVPWAIPDPLHEPWFNMPLAQHLAAYEAIPPGVFARHRSSVFAPPQLPDLIGIAGRRYLDKSGLQQHRGIVDLMRYAALNQGADDLGDYGGFIPAASDFKTTVDPLTQERYSDEQLYALALYLYSLRPPANPNPSDQLSESGRKVFERQGCASCHTPPAYTNNKLLPARGFEVPTEHRAKYEIMDVHVGTDPVLTMETRRGTGYYKVPSLLGVWYRGPFEHNGSVATLEDWFNADRLRDDYLPTGWKGSGVERRPVKGHEFGLKLTTTEKKALIAFLRTL
ncbi:MAG: hypothetical protein JWN34_5932 [Bryobacterales bacterium]|jgi:hypothetical protein|nr:hypothetical protein [Bryobacterales bacterium]